MFSTGFAHTSKAGEKGLLCTCFFLPSALSSSVNGDWVLAGPLLVFSLSSLGDPQIFEDGEILKKNRTNKLKIQMSTHWTLFRIKMGLI